MNVIGSLSWIGKVTVGIGRMIRNPYLMPKGEERGGERERGGKGGRERGRKRETEREGRNINKHFQHLLFFVSVSLRTFMNRKAASYFSSKICYPWLNDIFKTYQGSLHSFCPNISTAVPNVQRRHSFSTLRAATESGRTCSRRTFFTVK